MIFLDTGFLFALVSAKDEHHTRVVEVFRTFQNLRLADHVLTTNHVVAETITLARKVGHENAVRLGERLYGEKLARIHWTTPDEERAAFEYFKRHQDQAYSRAMPTDILHFPARVVVTPAGAPYRPQGIERREETADDHPHADHGPSAAVLRPPASGVRPPNRGRDRCHGPRRPSLDGTWVVGRGADRRL